MAPPKQPLLSMGLDEDGDHARRLLLLPQSGEMLAYGDDDGVVTLLTTTTTTSPSEEDEAGKKKKTTRVVQRYDEGVRAMAVSHDGKRMAIGFEDGTTTIYSFPDYDGSSSNGNAATHPFCAAASEKPSSQEEDDDLLMSQEITLPTPEHSMAGPSFGGPIRDLAFHPSSYWLAIANEDESCLVNVDSEETLTATSGLLKHDIAKHHDKCGLRGVSFSKDLLATLAMDGRLCVWQKQKASTGDTATEQPEWTLLEREANTCVPKKDLGEHLGADPSDRSCRPLIINAGKEDDDSTFILTPGQVQVLLRKLSVTNGERKMDSVPPSSDDGHIESVVALATFSAENTMYVLSSGRDGKIICWKVLQDHDGSGQDEEEGLKLVEILYEPTKEASVPTDLVVHNGKIYAALANGKYAILKLPKLSSRKEKSSSASPQKKSLSKKSSEAPWDDDSDDDEGFGASSSEKKDDKENDTTAPKNNRVRFVDDEAAEDDDDDATDDGLPKEETTSTDKGGQEFPSSQDAAAADDDDDEDDIMEDLGHASYESYLPSRRVKTIPPQAAFAPSSTPLDLERRFLCWNHVGAATLQRGDDDRNTIDISFTDSAFRRPISFTDNQNFIIGSLGDDGGIFASDLQSDDDQDDDLQQELDGLDVSERTKALLKESQKKRMKKDFNNPTGSSIFFYKFDTFGNLRDKDWYLTLPDGERVMGAACGEGWAAVATNRRFLRMFTSGGNQGQVAWLKGEPVTMAGRGRFLGVVYHEGEPSADGTQNLGYALYDTATFSVVSKGPVSCISKGSSLLWIGFSNDFSLLAMDSDGMVSMLAASSGSSWDWTPMLDTVGMRKSADDQFWPVTVYDGKLVCVPLKGGNSYPDASRRPVTTTLSMRLPLARSAVPKNSVLEELSVRSNMALAQKKIVNDITDADEDVEQEYLTLSAQVDKVTLKLFAATVEAGKLERALDLVDRLHLEKSYDLAITLADRHDKLADMIEDAKERRFAVDDNQGDYEEDVGYEEEEEESPSFGQTSAPSYKQISPDMNQNGKRSLSLSGNSLLPSKRRMNL